MAERLTPQQLKEILDLHVLWLRGDSKGRRAYLSDANLSGANLSGAKNLGQFVRCPQTGSFTAYKKADGLIVTLGVPESAKRINAIGSFKCRCSEAIVLSITNPDGSTTDVTSVASSHDPSFVYKVGERVTSEFDSSDRVECSQGIHFFMTHQEAVEY